MSENINFDDPIFAEFESTMSSRDPWIGLTPGPDGMGVYIELEPVDALAALMELARHAMNFRSIDEQSESVWVYEVTDAPDWVDLDSRLAAEEVSDHLRAVGFRSYIRPRAKT